MCNAGASNRSLCVQISRERSYIPANILTPLERQLIALQLAADSFCSMRNARIASAVLATTIPSVRPSVRPSVPLSHAGIVSKRSTMQF